MSKALEEVRQYSNEDVASIRKHWIIFVRMANQQIVKIFLILFLYFKIRKWINPIADEINKEFPQVPFELKKGIWWVIIIYLLWSVISKFVKTLVEYKTVGLMINNIQIKGKTGLIDIGIVNASLEQVTSVNIEEPLLGRIFNYGTIMVTLGNNVIVMKDMINTEQFQDAIIMLQEAQKEGRNIRNAERHAKTINIQTEAQVKVMGDISQAIRNANNIEENIKKVEIQEGNGLEVGDTTQYDRQLQLIGVNEKREAEQNEELDKNI